MRCEAVWCGTSNLHNVMRASCKSLLANSHVDHCYLLTDKIPKDQYYFDDPRVEWKVVDNKWFIELHKGLEAARQRWENCPED